MSGGADLAEILLEKMTHLERELSDVKEMIANRLAPIEAAAAKVTGLETRVLELEKAEERAKGAAMLGKALWAVLLGVGAAIGFAIDHFTH
jgi:hypothetical protein